MTKGDYPKTRTVTLRDHEAVGTANSWVWCILGIDDDHAPTGEVKIQFDRSLAKEAAARFARESAQAILDALDSGSVQWPDERNKS